MRERKTHKVIPPGHPLYFCFQMDEKRIGKVWLRVPNGIRLAEILSELGIVGRAYKKKDLTDKEKLQVSRDATSLLGAVLGMCWASPTHMLETREHDFEVVHDYGDEVIEELRDAGWRAPDFDKVSPLVFKAVNDRLVSEKEIEARADFFESPQVGGS